MGYFNIDLLKDDTSRPVHDYIEFIHSKSLNSNNLQANKNY